MQMEFGRKASDFQPDFNSCYIIINQDAPLPHPVKEASWGIPRGREGAWPGVGTKSGAGWKAGPYTLCMLSQARAGSSAEPCRVAVSCFGQGRVCLFPAAPEQICFPSGTLPLSILVLQGLQFQGVQFKAGTCQRSVHYGKSLGATDGPRDKVSRGHLIQTVVLKLARHELVNMWCPKDPRPAQPFGCEEGVL